MLNTYDKFTLFQTHMINLLYLLICVDYLQTGLEKSIGALALASESHPPPPPPPQKKKNSQ